MICKGPVEWHKCYSGNYDLQPPEVTAHPAKAAWGLAFRIIGHLEELGLLRPGDAILDPMAGTGRFNLAGLAQGYDGVSVELEPRFISFLEQSKEYASRKLGRALPWRILQGDARNLAALLDGAGYRCVMSPPYMDAEVTRGRMGIAPMLRQDKRAQREWEGYGHTPGQIGNLKDRPLKAVLSPSYIGEQKGAMGGDNWFTRHPEIRNNKSAGGTVRGNLAPYSPGNIGNLPDRPLKSITSPPYAGDVSDSPSDPHPERMQGGKQGYRGQYGATPGQIGRIKVITSPPYEQAQSGGGISAAMRGEGNYHMTTRLPGNLYQPSEHGTSEGQLGAESGEDYLSAMAQVYAEIARCCSVLCVVLKDPTRNGKLRPLGEDTIRLLEATGWQLICHHRARLFEEQETADLFGTPVRKPKGRLSFFKSLAYKKGLEIADSEHVLIAVRPEAAGG